VCVCVCVFVDFMFIGWFLFVWFFFVLVFLKDILNVIKNPCYPKDASPRV